MIKLYVRFSCLFCIIVIEKAKELGMKEGKDYQLIDAEEGTAGRRVVLKEGGIPQVPFMIDGTKKMYESRDIIKYMEKKFK